MLRVHQVEHSGLVLARDLRELRKIKQVGASKLPDN